MFYHSYQKKVTNTVTKKKWQQDQGVASVREQAEDRKWGWASKPPSCPILLSTISLHLLKDPQVSKPVPPARIQVFKHISVWGHSLYKPPDHSLLSSACQTSAFVAYAQRTGQIIIKQDTCPEVGLIFPRSWKPPETALEMWKPVSWQTP